MTIILAGDRLIYRLTLNRRAESDRGCVKTMPRLQTQRLQPERPGANRPISTFTVGIQSLGPTDPLNAFSWEHNWGSDFSLLSAPSFLLYLEGLWEW